MWLAVWLSFCLAVWLTVWLAVWLLVCLSVWLAVCLADKSEALPRRPKTLKDNFVLAHWSEGTQDFRSNPP